ncbi:hypothetical protein SETIT_8G063300v2 [Setaria italica]|uniref:Protein kinase domain-containing protein n=1 Tax=Setaria italica TaxID=4555 RepID=A0A368S536_SETIT|nr:hypothetical protein SETIT_8G063300v2 [Setaria italica]
MRAGSIVNATGDSSGSWNAPFGPGFTENGYQLSYSNEIVVSGCNVVARILADIREKTPRIIGGCASFCTIIDREDGPLTLDTTRETKNKYCTGTGGCCQASVSASGTPNAVEAKWLYSGNHTAEQHLQPAIVFIAEEGWVDKNGLLDDELEEVPIVLEWSVTQGLSHWNNCHDDMRQRVLCKSEQSRCSSDSPGRFTCQCEDGYDGNPYLLGGCQDIDECELPSEENGCFGDCINTIGSMECRCPHGTFGNPGIRGGCVKINSTTDPQLPTVAPVPLGLPHCNTTCGDVSVPYPFGISRGCYRPGFNLTCSTSYDPPRLLLDSNGTLEVINISLHDSTVRVIHHARTYNNATSLSEYGTIVYWYIPDVGEPYMLSTKNEFIFSGCNVEATLYGEYRNDSSNSTDRIISRCNSTCSSGSKYILFEDHSARPLAPTHTNGGYCSGRGDGCCHAPIAADSTPKRMEFKGLNLHTKQEYNFFLRAGAFISEDRLTDQWYKTLNRTDFSMSFYMSSPHVLRTCSTDAISIHTHFNLSTCMDIHIILSSSFTIIVMDLEEYVSQCSCWLATVVDECRIMALSKNLCFGKCINFPGGHECRCPRGSYGNPYKPSGCYPAGLIIGLSVASGAALLPMVLGIIFVRRKIKQRRVKALKQKYFKQNRGQLLQQLLSQKADIAERMIIPVDELAKATNNFDKAREIGGGGHGTVYKGILSDLHVVAIKKSKITVQKEIDEFINEVAILSQINHKNVVKLFGCCLETEVPLLVYEFISNGTLYHHLHVEGPRSLSWRHRLRIATEIASSLAYLHSTVLNPIIHRDIKSSNILLDDKLMAKVSDFGTSRYIPMDNEGLTTRIQGTRGYMDPMCFHTGRLTEKSDVYSFGVLLVELLTRKKPFSYLSTEGDRLAAHFVNLLAKGNVIEIIDPQVIEEGGEEIQEVAALASSCVNVRSEERPTMRQVEHILEGLWGSKKYKKDDTNLEKFQKQAEGQRNEESSRRYSLEQEMMMSSTFPR